MPESLRNCHRNTRQCLPSWRDSMSWRGSWRFQILLSDGKMSETHRLHATETEKLPGCHRRALINSIGGGYNLGCMGKNIRSMTWCLLPAEVVVLVFVLVFHPRIAALRGLERV